VWRRCLNTGEAFPVLSRWDTWVHAGCPQIHQVDLQVSLPAPAGRAEKPGGRHMLADDLRADATVLCEAVCADGHLAGRLYLDHAVLGLWPADGQPVVLSALADIRSAVVTAADVSHGASHRRWWRRRHSSGAPACRLTLQLADDADLPMEIEMDAGSLRDALRPHLPVA
jgi:hypothetical protein